MHPPTQLMLPSTSAREALLACPQSPSWNLPSFTVESTLSSPCSGPDSLSFAKVQLSLILTLSPLTIWCSGLTALFLFLLASACQLLSGTEATLSFSAGPVGSSFSAKACAILQALCWPRQHQQVCHFSSLLLLSESRSVLFFISPFTAISLADLAGTVFSLLLYYQAAMGPRIFVSPWERRG